MREIYTVQAFTAQVIAPEATTTLEQQKQLEAWLTEQRAAATIEIDE